MDSNSKLWDAPYSPVPVMYRVDVPGSKSLTNRYLVLAALASGSSVLRAPLFSRDTDLMLSGLRVLGAGISVKQDVFGEFWEVDPIDLSGRNSISRLSSRVENQIFCGLSGNVMRFLPPVAFLVGGRFFFDGDSQAYLRPMKGLLDALCGLGANIGSGNNVGFLPFSVCRDSFLAGEVCIDGSQSSQFISALLLCGWRFPRGLKIVHIGDTLPSVAHIDMTVNVLRSLGISVVWDSPNEWVVSCGLIEPFSVSVEPDLSSAAPFMAAALVTGGEVVVSGWPGVTSQAGKFFPKILESMGAEVSYVAEGSGGGYLQVCGGGRIFGVDVDLRHAGELVPVVAALAALAESPSTIRNIAHLAGHETNRLVALVEEINRLGGRALLVDDSIQIFPQTLKGAVVRTYNDHRMAMMGAVIGLAVPNVRVENIATTAKTLPNFSYMWCEMLRNSYGK